MLRKYIDYSITVGKALEEIKLRCYDREGSSHDYKEFSFNLGDILLLIMESVPILRQVYDISKNPCNSSLLDDVYKIYSDNPKAASLYTNVLNNLYEYEVKYVFDEYCDYIEVLSNLYNYLCLCMREHKYYDVKYLSYIASFSAMDLQLPGVMSLPTTDHPTVLVDITCHELNEEEIKERFEALEKCNMVSFHSYEVRCLADICFSSLYELITNDFHIKKCEHCGRWFIEYGKNEKYCNGSSPTFRGLSCKEAAKREKEALRLKEDSNRMLKNLRQMFYNSGDVGGLKRLNEQNRAKKEQLKLGILSEDDYLLWLKSQYKKKYK